MKFKTFVVLTAGACLAWSVGPSTAKVRRLDSGNWIRVFENPTLSNQNALVTLIGWPVGVNGVPLRINPLGTVPADFHLLASPPSYIAVSGFDDGNGSPQLGVAAVTLWNTNDEHDYHDDAQLLGCYAQDGDDEDGNTGGTPCNAYYADESRLVRGLNLEWRTNPANSSSLRAQVMFFDLRSTPASEPIRDARGSNIGNANGAWQIGFNCATAAQTAVCPDPASLEWEGQVYTATRQVLTSADSNFPDIDPALNQFVFNAGTLYPPPGWLANTATGLVANRSTAIIGDAVTFTATVSVVKAVAPTGNVTFREGSTVLGTFALNSSGVATLTTAILAQGVHTVTAAYVGDARSAPSTSATFTVTVSAPAPTLTFSANPSAIPLGQASTLSWQAQNATSCTAGNAWSGAKAVSGSQQVTPAVAGTATYALDCTGPGGSISRTAEVTVHAPPTANVSVAPATIKKGDSATVTWTSTGSTTCSAGGAWTGAVASSGSQSVTGSAVGTLTYTLTCTGPGGSANASSSLVVEKGGGGSLSVWSNIALLLLTAWRWLFTRRSLRRYEHARE